MGIGVQSVSHAHVATQLTVQRHCRAVKHQSSIHVAHVFLPRRLSCCGACLGAVTATHMHVFPRPPCVKVPLRLPMQRKEDLCTLASEAERAANVQPAFEEAPLQLPASPLGSREPSSLAAVVAHGGRESTCSSAVTACVLLRPSCCSNAPRSPPRQQHKPCRAAKRTLSSALFLTPHADCPAGERQPRRSALLVYARPCALPRHHSRQSLQRLTGTVACANLTSRQALQHGIASLPTLAAHATRCAPASVSALSYLMERERSAGSARSHSLCPISRPSPLTRPALTSAALARVRATDAVCHLAFAMAGTLCAHAGGPLFEHHGERASQRRVCAVGATAGTPVCVGPPPCGTCNTGRLSGRSARRPLEYHHLGPLCPGKCGGDPPLQQSCLALGPATVATPWSRQHGRMRGHLCHRCIAVKRLRGGRMQTGCSLWRPCRLCSTFGHPWRRPAGRPGRSHDHHR